MRLCPSVRPSVPYYNYLTERLLSLLFNNKIKNPAEGKQESKEESWMRGERNFIEMQRI